MSSRNENMNMQTLGINAGSCGVKSARQTVAADDSWHRGEQAASKAVAEALEQWRVQSDAAQERLFGQLCGKT